MENEKEMKRFGEEGERKRKTKTIGGRREAIYAYKKFLVEMEEFPMKKRENRFEMIRE